MPYKAPKPCKHPGCPNLVQPGISYCDQHKLLHAHEYDKNRPSSSKRGYGTRWHKYREQYLNNHPLCINYEECRNVATIVDHKIPVNVGGSFWDSNNHQPMCKHCHDRKTAAEDGGFGNERVAGQITTGREGREATPSMISGINDA